MPFDPESQWERDLSRELKALPEIPAPNTLMSRVLQRIPALGTKRWYQCSWQEWSPAWRAMSFTVLFALFAVASFGLWNLYHGPMAAAFMGQLEATLARASAVWNTLTVLGGTAVLVVRNIGTGWLILFVGVASLSYALCVGAGTATIRLLVARHKNYPS